MAITNKQPVGNRIFTFDAVPTNVPAEGLQPGDFVLDSSTNYLYLVSVGHALVQVAAQGGSQAVLSTTVTLHDADIRALNVTPFQILATPGPNKAYILITAIGQVSTVAGAYTVVSTPTYYIVDGVGFGIISNAFDEDHEGAFGSAGAALITWSPAQGSNVPNRATYASDVATNKDQPMTLLCLNGSLTGGNAANTLKLTVYYAILDLS